MQQIAAPTAEQSIEVNAPADACWSLVADVTRTPEWSPVCHRCEWIDGTHEPVVGARFRGHNRLNGARWSRDCEITRSETARILAFSTLFKGEESTRWRYTFEPVGETTTRITEAYEIVRMPRWVRFLRRLPGAMAKTERDTERNISTSLERIKALAEGTAGGR